MDGTPPTARKFHLLLLPQDALTDKNTTCWRCCPEALATPWPILPMLARYHHAPTTNATPKQHRWLHTLCGPAPADAPASIAWGPDATAELRIHQGTLNTKHPAITYPVIAEHRSATPEVSAHSMKHHCSHAVPEEQTIDWTRYHPKNACLLQ